MNSTGTKDIKKIQDEITAFLSAHGAAQVGFCKAADNEFKLGYAISYTVHLSNAVIDCIDTAPTHTNFHNYSHKRAAVDSGLGTIGKSSLFLSNKFGPRVRLGTILTDCPFEVRDINPTSVCGGCRICTNACPAMAIVGKEWSPGTPRDEIIDAQACSDYMKRAFKHIGRGAVCGICMRVCPHGIKNKQE